MNDVVPLIPQTNGDVEWAQPTEYPDLTAYDEISVDLETNDPHLEDMGPGWARNDGYIIGMSVAVEGGQWYFPIRHGNGPNLDPRITLKWLQEVCGYTHKTYVFHNATYDVGWLETEGVIVKGRIIDTMVAAPLLDENRFSYSLNNLGRDYLGEKKNERELKEAAKAFGLHPKRDMWKLPAHFVGAYAEQDAALTLRLWHRFRVLVEQEELTSIFELEIALIPLILKMRRRGVRVDIEKATEVEKSLKKWEKDILEKILSDYGVAVEIWSAASIAKAFDSAGLQYGRTAKSGAPSFTKAFLDHHPHDLPKLILKAREFNKAQSTFVDSILRHNYKGRIHAEMHQLRSDDGGTITGRFSYSNPNLQQIPNPKKNKEIGNLIRSLFLPEEGERWCSLDYSNQEPRLVVHYAEKLNLRGAALFGDKIREDKTTDFHRFAADILGMERDPVKTINLGLFYGMGRGKLAASLGLSAEDADALFSSYHERVPFVRDLSDHASRRASLSGRIRTLLGRVGRFELWEPRAWGVHNAKSRENAERDYGVDIKRAFTYKSLNKLIQGSAADQTKRAMVDLHREGIVPLIQVHDELDISVADDKTISLSKEIMENAVELTVPSLVEPKVGPNWGTLSGLAA